ncbi:GspH/FimT family pseudopilin [Pseudomonadota bacterium]
MKIKGLTLIELMITLAIAGILIASAAPSMREFIQNNRSATQINELQATLNLGRSEAIKRNNNITVCKSSNGTGCAGTWQDGWIVFVDNDLDGNVDAGVDEILRVHGGLVEGNTLRFTQTRVSYANSGLARTGSSGVFIHCDSRGAQYARGLVVGPSGRARLFTESDFRNIMESNEDLERYLCS